MPKFLIKNGKIWDGEKFFFSDVLTEDEHIAKIAQDINEEADYVFDAKGKIVSAGLVDMHVHLKGISSDMYGIQAEMSSLPFGVTAVNIAGCVYCNRALLDSFAVKNTIFISVKLRNNHACLELSKEKFECYSGRAIGIKVFFDDITKSNLRDITPLEEACDYARRNNFKVMVHCTNSPTSMLEIVKTLSKGDILTHIFHGGENSCTENNFEAFKLAKQKGVILDCGFAADVHVNFPNFESSIKAGFLPDTIGTDITCTNAYMSGGRYGMPMCMSFAKKAGMSEEEIFKAVTSTPAKALGKEKEWGYLAVGRRADIAVFDYTDEGFDIVDRQGNRFQSGMGYRCVFTVLDGQIVYKY